MGSTYPRHVVDAQHNALQAIGVDATDLMLELGCTGSNIRGIKAQVKGVVKISRRRVAEVRCTGERVRDNPRGGSERHGLTRHGWGFAGSLLDADELEVGDLPITDRTLHVLLADDVESTGKASGAKGVGARLQDSKARRVRCQADGAVSRISIGRRDAGVGHERRRALHEGVGRRELDRCAERPVLLWSSVGQGSRAPGKRIRGDQFVGCIIIRGLVREVKLRLRGVEMVLGALRDGVEDVMTVSRWRLEERVGKTSGLVGGGIDVVASCGGISKDVGGVGLEVEGKGFVIEILSVVDIVGVFVVVLIDVEQVKRGVIIEVEIHAGTPVGDIARWRRELCRISDLVQGVNGADSQEQKALGGAAEQAPSSSP